ncbi:polyhydroxybutyrate depolymerase [Pedobacter sp. AK017]|uniref:extracellular catalytic domain type 1 short-chain-length polyhydroxyalkanoate depolymerase n=1 Tax=Pedobacter sp. AK017 TaxID=2723073 RepID=UPI00161929D0|nr:PHB depolymerase family esterase [Pedobacter sp. AK017]MBB5438918.1 polyhydroxybutyrate depolymerase [Pedobacter sp. AK017]
MKTLFKTLVAGICLVIFLGCAKNEEPEKIYRIAGKMNIDNRNRTYLLNLPPDYYNNESTVPLVIALHGTGGSAAQFERDYRFTDQTNRTGFAVVYPEGVRSDGVLKLRTWNAGTCCHYAYEQNVDDVKYVRTLIDHLISTYKINTKKIYVTGMSNGGMMAYRLAAELSDKIAAVAPVSATMVLPGAIQPSRPVPILHIHSVKDTIVPYAGGVGLGGYTFAPVDSVLRVWAAKNACAASPQVIVDDQHYKLTEWKDCSNAATIRCYLTRDGGHSWPGGKKSNPRGDEPSSAINASELICNFFQGNSLP